MPQARCESGGRSQTQVEVCGLQRQDSPTPHHSVPSAPSCGQRGCSTKPDCGPSSHCQPCSCFVDSPTESPTPTLSRVLHSSSTLSPSPTSSAFKICPQPGHFSSPPLPPASPEPPSPLPAPPREPQNGCPSLHSAPQLLPQPSEWPSESQVRSHGPRRPLQCSHRPRNRLSAVSTLAAWPPGCSSHTSDQSFPCSGLPPPDRHGPPGPQLRDTPWPPSVTQSHRLPSRGPAPLFQVCATPQHLYLICARHFSMPSVLNRIWCILKTTVFSVYDVHLFAQIFEGKIRMHITHGQC